MVVLSSSISADVPSFASVTTPASGPNSHELGRIDVDPDGLHTFGRPAPTEMHQFEAASDPDQEIASGPVLIGRAGQKPVGAVVSDHALAAAEAGDRRLDQFGERRHLFRGVLGAGADDDQRVARFADQPGDFLGSGRCPEPAAAGRSCRHRDRHVLPCRTHPTAPRSPPDGCVPLCICRNASATTRGASVAWSMRSAQPVKPRMVASWSGSSWSWPRPRPIRSDMILPVTHRTGALAP